MIARNALGPHQLKLDYAGLLPGEALAPLALEAGPRGADDLAGVASRMAETGERRQGVLRRLGSSRPSASKRVTGRSRPIPAARRSCPHGATIPETTGCEWRLCESHRCGAFTHPPITE